MKRTFLLLSVLLLSAAWAMAQNGGGYSNNEGSNSSHASQVTVQGCLGEEGGNFTLTEPSGTTYQLVGNTEKLRAHVGHTMRVTGTSTSAAQVPGSMSETTETQPTLSVTSFKHVSSNCGETSGTGSY
jgi:uncharacterized protein DUF5818